MTSRVLERWGREVYLENCQVSVHKADAGVTKLWEHLMIGIYRISSVIRQRFFSLQNNPKVLDPSCKTDLDLWHCLGRVELVL